MAGDSRWWMFALGWKTLFTQVRASAIFGLIWRQSCDFYICVCMFKLGLSQTEFYKYHEFKSVDVYLMLKDVVYVSTRIRHICFHMTSHSLVFVYIYVG